MTTDSNRNKVYSPWMNSWEENFKKPKKETRNIFQNSIVKGFIWVSFFALLISPIFVIVIGPLLSANGGKESTSTGTNANDIKRLIGETEKSIWLGKYDKAIQRANYLISENSDIPKIYVLAGLAYYYQQNYQNAIEFANEALKVNPRYSPADYLIGMCSYKSGIEVNAELISKSVSSEYEYSYIVQTIYFDETSNYDEMLSAAKNGCQMNTDSLLMHYFLALAQFRNAEFVEAIESIDDLAKFRADGQISSSAIMFRAMVLKAEIFLTLGKYNEAFEILQENYTSYQDSWELNKVFSEYYMATSKYLNVTQLLAKYGDPQSKQNMNFDVLNMYSLRASSYFKAMNFEMAFSVYKNILKIETGLNDEEIKDLDLIQSYFTPACHEALLKLAQIEQLRGNIENSRNYLKHIESDFLSDDEISELNDLKTKLNQ